MAAGTRGPLNRVSAFWDTSALVPLLVRQSNTSQAVAVYKTLDVVVWWATPVEIASAVARLLRTGKISTDDFAKSRNLANALFSSWAVIFPTDAIRATSMQLVERYDLRAEDSLQLAAALHWCGDAPQGRIFLSGDQKLHDAALLSGFDAKRL